MTKSTRLISANDKDIKKEIAKLHDGDSKFLYSHMYKAVANEELRIHLALEITTENGIRTARLYDIRTNETIKE